jgi:CHAT domain-containing protein
MGVYRYSAAMLLSIVLLVTGTAFEGQEGAIGMQPIAQTANKKKAEADRLFEKGNQQYQTSQFQLALKSWQQALQMYRGIRDRKGEVKALNGLGGAHYFLDNYDEATDYHKKALAIAKTIKDRKGEGESLNSLGNVLQALGKYDEAIDLHQKSLIISKAIKDEKGEMEAIISLGDAYYFIDNYTKAIGNYKQSLAISQRIKNKKGQRESLSGLGDVNYLMDNYATALGYHTQGLDLARKIEDRQGEVESLRGLGSIYEFLNEYSKAIRLYEQGLAIARKIGDRQNEGLMQSNLGSVSKAQGDNARLSNPQEALNYYENAKIRLKESLKIAIAIGDQQGEGQTSGDLGNVYEAEEDYSNAIKFYERYLLIAKEIDDQLGEAQALFDLGNVYELMKDPQKAINYQLDSLSVARKIKNREGEASVFSGLGSILSNNKNPQIELAIVFYKRSVNISESIRGDNLSLSRETQESYISSIAKTYRNLADLLLTQGRTREAQEILELLKVQENRGYDRASQSQQPTVQLTLHPLEQQALQTFETTIARKQPLTLQDYQKLYQTLTQNRDRLIKDGNGNVTTIGNPQNLIANPKTLLIQNLVVNDKIWVLWTSQTGGTQAIATPVPQTELDQTVKQFREQLSSPTSSLPSLQATSRKLYNWLIPPALQTELAQHPKQHLIFSLDHVTRYIPVATLHDGQTYLTQRYQLSNVITTDTNTTDRLPPPAQTPVLALGTAQAFPNFSELKFVPIELQNISQDGNPQGLYPGQKYLNAGFNRDILKRLDRYRIVHIATHGQFNPTNILNSFLLLGNGDRLPISEIDQLTNLTNTHLVVLSACETGLGEVKSDGTEISGMSGYFLYRGAKSVMASLWSVSDPSTALFMQQFYRHLADGKTKAEGIQQVQNYFIQGQLTKQDAENLSEGKVPPKDLSDRPRSNAQILTSWAQGGGSRSAVSLNYTHPFYWAPFTLVGNSL